MVKLNYNVPISEVKQDKDDSFFFIEGVAINAGVTGNNHRFTVEELSKSAPSLKGVPLLEDHRNEVGAIRGRVVDARYDEGSSNIPFKARVSDKNAIEMIKRGDLDSVSVGADVEDIKEEDGAFTLFGVKFRELSLVAVGADERANFAVAVREAYETKQKNNSMEVNRMVENKEKDVVPKPEENKEELVTQAEEQSNEVSGEAEPKPEDGASEALKEMQESIKALSDNIKSISEELKTLKEGSKIKEEVEKKEVAEKPEDEDEEDESGVEEQLRFVQGSGSIKGGSYTLVR